MLVAVKDQTKPHQNPASASEETNDMTGPYWLDVFATDIDSVVRLAGGWLYDQAARGWRVTVLVDDTDDHRALRILGVGVLDLTSARAGAQRRRLQLLAAAARILQSDPQPRALVLGGFSNSHTEIAVWGRRLSPRQKKADWVQYCPSPAALAFKRQALLAAAANPTVSGVEEYWCGAASCVAPPVSPT